MFRKEQDALGTIQVPARAFRGSYTQRVLSNFPATGNKVPLLFLRTYIRVKKAYAQANHKAKKLSKPLRDHIVNACKELLAMNDKELGKLCPIDQIQSGGGTSTNMLINEIIANTASKNLKERPGSYKTITPHDHVNMSQSSNDTFPGTTKIVSLVQLNELTKILDKIEAQYTKLAAKYTKTRKVARTHLQDAIIIHLGDELSAFARTIAKNKKYLSDSFNVLLEVNFGGTAVGSKQNITSQLRKLIIEQMKLEFKLPVKQPRNYFEQSSSSGDLMHLAHSLNHLAIDTIKQCNDLRLLASGPLAGIGELKLPEVQPGSSIMPGKINPSIPEALTMICAKVQGNTKTIEILSTQAQLQLQQFGPGIARALYDSLDLLTHGYEMFLAKCLKGLKADEKRIHELLDNSFAYATEYAEKLGYDVVAEAVVQAIKSGCCLREVLEG